MKTDLVEEQKLQTYLTYLDHTHIYASVGDGRGTVEFNACGPRYTALIGVHRPGIDCNAESQRSPAEVSHYRAHKEVKGAL